MVILLLALEVSKQMGRTSPVKVVFYDEEFVYPETLKSVEDAFALDGVEGYRLCLKMPHHLRLPDGKDKDFITWDTSRKLLREKPADGLFDDDVYDMTEGERAVKKLVFGGDNGKSIVQLVGVRAQESITRRTAIMSSYKRGKFCFLLNSHILNVKIAEPIYDWNEKDVFFYLSKNQIVLPLNDIYYQNLITKQRLRVSMPFHGAGHSNIKKMREQSPEFYDAICEVFPEMNSSNIYLGNQTQINYDAVIQKYGNTLHGIKRYIKEEMDDDLKVFSYLLLKQFIKDYIENDRYLKRGFTYEQAVHRCFVGICKKRFGKPILLDAPPKSKKKSTI